MWGEMKDWLKNGDAKIILQDVPDELKGKDDTKGEASLRGSAAFRRAQELIPSAPGLTYTVTDGSRYGTVLEELTNLLAHMPSGAVAGDQSASFRYPRASPGWPVLPRAFRHGKV